MNMPFPSREHVESIRKNYPPGTRVMLNNILSYMSNRLIGIGDSVAAIDELYLFLTNQTAIEYIRNSMKRVRKKDSCVVLASQNIEDFLIPSIREFTKPMFSIHSFSSGNVFAMRPSDCLCGKYPVIFF